MNEASPTLESHRVHVFGDGPLRGNEAAVVLVPRGFLRPSDMQAAAARNPVPVTVFAELGAETPTVRFFATRVELPYCGHGVLAAARVLLSRSGVDELVLRGRTGTVLVRREGDVVFARTTEPATLEHEDDAVPVLRALGIDPETCLAVHRGSIGSAKWLVELRDRAALDAVAPDFDRLARLSQERGVNGAYAFHRSFGEADANARGFHPRGGTNEDRATGVAAGALAWLLRRDDPTRSRFVIEQGVPSGPRHRIVVRVDPDAGTEIGGRAYPVGPG